MGPTVKFGPLDYTMNRKTSGSCFPMLASSHEHRPSWVCERRAWEAWELRSHRIVWLRLEGSAKVVLLRFQVRWHTFGFAGTLRTARVGC